MRELIFDGDDDEDDILDAAPAEQSPVARVMSATLVRRTGGPQPFSMRAMQLPMVEPPMETSPQREPTFIQSVPRLLEESIVIASPPRRSVPLELTAKREQQMREAIASGVWSRIRDLFIEWKEEHDYLG